MAKNKGNGGGGGQGGGSRGSSGGRGQGKGSGRGRKNGGQGLDLGSNCICPNCGKKVPHTQGVPCTDITCSECGQLMNRE